MAPDETGGRSRRILPEIDGTVASVDGAGIAGETVAPYSGKRTNLITVVQTPRVRNARWRNTFRQGQCLDPQPNHRRQLRPTGHGSELGHEINKGSIGTTGDKKLQALRQAIQFSWPVRQG